MLGGYACIYVCTVYIYIHRASTVTNTWGMVEACNRPLHCGLGGIAFHAVFTWGAVGYNVPKAPNIVGSGIHSQNHTMLP